MGDKLVELTGSFGAYGLSLLPTRLVDEHGQEINAGRMNLGVVTLTCPGLPREPISGMSSGKVLRRQLGDSSFCQALCYCIERAGRAPQRAYLYQHGLVAS